MYSKSREIGNFPNTHHFQFSGASANNRRLPACDNRYRQCWRIDMQLQHETLIAYLKAKRAFVAFIACASFLLSIWNIGSAQNAQKKTSAKTANAAEPSNALVARGKYIVEGLSRCGQCHTPRDSNGNPERNEWLEGAAVWLKAGRTSRRLAAQSAPNCRRPTRNGRRDGHPVDYRNLARRKAIASTHAAIPHDSIGRGSSGRLFEVLAVARKRNTA